MLPLKKKKKKYPLDQYARMNLKPKLQALVDETLTENGPLGDAAVIFNE